MGQAEDYCSLVVVWLSSNIPFELNKARFRLDIVQTDSSHSDQNLLLLQDAPGLESELYSLYSVVTSIHRNSHITAACVVSFITVIIPL